MGNPTEVELLAPAKNTETGIAAINHGADAVYIGFEQFGAREAAGNSLNDIEKLVNYAHIFHSKVYITLNTILFENEIDLVNKVINNLYKIGADAIIIQDMGILEMDLPPIAIHASTQTHNSSIEKIKFLEDIGIQRVVVARELNINEIREIRNNTTIELEAFIHGALCVSYSGQCYFSQAITGRSANRGACAQPCRSIYSLVDEDGNVLARNKHLLSLMDLNQTDNIKSLINSGITSLKIEGRLKGIDYVKNITAHYRTILDRIIGSDKSLLRASSGKTTFFFEPDPYKTFNRGYSSYFTNERQKGLVSLNTQKSLGKFIGKVAESNEKSFSLDTNIEVRNNDGLCFFDNDKKLKGFKVNKVEDGNIYPNQIIDFKKGTSIYRNYDHHFYTLLKNGKTSNRQVEAKLIIDIEERKVIFRIIDEDSTSTEVIIDEIVEIASNPDSLIQNIQKQVVKTGNTPIRIVEISIEKKTQNLPFITISQINELRRRLIENHISNRISTHKLQKSKVIPNSVPYPNKSLTFKANVSNSLAQKFYQRHGVENIEKAFELQSNFSSKEIMETKYCILCELGYCDGKNGSKFSKKKLYLQDNNRKYPLQFNCKECKMKILFE